MDDVRLNEMEGGMEGRVTAVFSRGWISIPLHETGGVERLICKTRVLIEAPSKL